MNYKMRKQERLYRIALITVCFACLAVNTTRLAVLQHGVTGAFWIHVDSPQYFANADALGEGRRLVTIFKERLILPALLHWTGATAERPWTYLYLIQGLHFFFPLILAGMGRMLFKSRMAGAVSALLYLVYNPAGDASRMVLTDFPHAFLATLGICYTLKFLRTRRWRELVAAVAGWGLAMLTRPTFMGAWYLFAPVLAGSWLFGEMPLRKVLAFWAALLVVPAWFSVQSYADFGVWTSSFAAFENTHTALVPAVKTLLRKREGDDGRISVIFMEEERNRKAMGDPEYRALGMWTNGIPDDKTAFRTAFARFRVADREVLLRNYEVAFRMVENELGNLLFGSRARWILGGRGRPVFTCAAVLGLVLLWGGYRQRGAALLLFICCGVVFVPSAFGLQLWWGGRVALPGEVLFMVLTGGALATWRRLAGVAGLCALYKMLNVFRYNPMENGVAIGIVALAVSELFAWWKVRRGKRPVRPGFVGRRYVPRTEDG